MKKGWKFVVHRSILCFVPNSKLLFLEALTMSFFKEETREVMQTVASFFKWLLIAVLTGTAGAWWARRSI